MVAVTWSLVCIPYLHCHDVLCDRAEVYCIMWQVDELETKVKKAIEEITRLEQQLSGVGRERKQLADEAAKLDQQLSQTSKEKQKVSNIFMLIIF